MKHLLPVLLCIVLCGAAPAYASGIDVDLNLHLSNQGSGTRIVSDPPLFLESNTLGLQVSVGTSYPMFHIEGRYFLFQGGRWMTGPSYDGPWGIVRHDRLPPGLARRSNREIFAVREAESERYRSGRYHGRTFRPAKARHDHKREYEHEDHDRGHGNWKHERD